MPYRGDAVSTEVTHVWIDSDRALAQAAAGWQGALGIDTEFMRTDTFYPIPGLYQIADATGIWLIDPLAIEDWSPLTAILNDPGIAKVMHACSEDLELLSHHLGVEPSSLFDTQLAFAFLSENFSASYASLAKTALDVDLEKHQTRSNWLRRPLSEDQLHYASVDVLHLLPLFDKMRGELEEFGRWDWYLEDMASHGRYSPTAPHDYFATVKRAWKLGGQQLAVLKELCAWREQQAMREDVPRARVVWDEHLFEFASQRELERAAVDALLPRPVSRRYASEILAAHEVGLAAPEEGPLPRPLTQGQGGVLKRLRDLARVEASALGIAPELLARKRSVEQCFRHYHATGELSPDYRGWRADVLGEAFLNVLAES